MKLSVANVKAVLNKPRSRNSYFFEKNGQVVFLTIYRVDGKIPNMLSRYQVQEVSPLHFGAAVTYQFTPIKN